jgi:hypothetical protein
MHLEPLECRTMMSAAAHTVTVPIHGKAEGNLPANVVVGTETHLGKYTGAFNADGLFIITTASGDELWVAATLTPTDDPAEWVVTGNYVGGTGRFEGASGPFSHGLTFVDGQGDFVYEVDAAITLQRPWNGNA